MNELKWSWWRRSFQCDKSLVIRSQAWPANVITTWPEYKERQKMATSDIIGRSRFGMEGNSDVSY